jgi:hypothetical protein
VSELVDTITRLKDDVHAEIEWMNKTGSQSRATFLKWEKERDRVGNFLERCGWYMITWIGEVVWRGECLYITFVRPLIFIYYQWMHPA